MGTCGWNLRVEMGPGSGNHYPRSFLASSRKCHCQAPWCSTPRVPCNLLQLFRQQAPGCMAGTMSGLLLQQSWWLGELSRSTLHRRTSKKNSTFLEHSFCSLQRSGGSLGLLVRYACLVGHLASSLQLPPYCCKQPIWSEPQYTVKTKSHLGKFILISGYILCTNVHWFTLSGKAQILLDTPLHPQQVYFQCNRKEKCCSLSPFISIGLDWTIFS